MADAIDWSVSAMDSCSVRAIFGGRKQARIPQIGAKTARSVMPGEYACTGTSLLLMFSLHLFWTAGVKAKLFSSEHR